MEKLKKCLKLFLTFAKIGLFTFGGGYAMISIIEDECVDKKKWISNDEMMTMTVLSQSTPGPIAINSATYVGYKIAGFWGSLACTVGVVVPSFIIIFLISLFLDNILDYPVIAHAFNGIKVAVGVLIVAVGMRMFVKTEKKILPMIILATSLLLMLAIDVFSLKFSSIYMIIISGFIGFFAYLFSKVKGGADK